MWLNLLRKAVQVEGSQAAVARKIGYSPAAVSSALAGNYNGSTEAIRAAVLKTYGEKAMNEKPVPEGYKRNAVGSLVPIDRIKEIDLTRDDFVLSVAEQAWQVSAVLNNFKVSLSQDIQAFLELSAEKYGADMGGVKGNLSLTSFDGKYKVMRCVADRLEFNEQLQAAKELVDRCLREWTRDSDSKVQALIEQAFQTDKKGKINTKRILALRQLKIEDEVWQKAMEAIGDAVTVASTCTYFRVYERDDKGEYRQIQLDFSGV